jgi:6-phosphogluconolactonase (cycloisomerase 2 family)
MERQLHNYYGWDPLWSGAGAMAAPYSAAPYFGFGSSREPAYVETDSNDNGPHLHSIAEVTGYRIDATDGEIGHVENFLLESATWDICYLVVDTRNWWPGKHVLMSPYGVTEIDWSERQIHVNMTRHKIETSPPWDPVVLMNQPEMKRLHAHYGWPGFGG